MLEESKQFHPERQEISEHSDTSNENADMFNGNRSEGLASSNYRN
jgi:hypothetical protein